HALDLGLLFGRQLSIFHTEDRAVEGEGPRCVLVHGRKVADARHALLARGAPAFLREVDDEALRVDDAILREPALGQLLDPRIGIELAQPPLDIVDALDLEADLLQPERIALGRLGAVWQQADAEIPIRQVDRAARPPG